MAINYDRAAPDLQTKFSPLEVEADERQGAPVFDVLALMSERPGKASSAGLERQPQIEGTLGLPSGKNLLAKADEPPSRKGTDSDKDRAQVMKDEQGRITKIARADGSVSFEYDKTGKLITAVTRNEKGLVTKEEIPGGNTTTFEHDEKGELKKSVVTNKDGQVIESDKRLASGNWISRLYNDKGELQKQTITDKDGKLLKVKYADGSSSEYTYDEKGEKSSRLDRDKNGHLERVLSADQLKQEKSLYENAKVIADTVEKKGHVFTNNNYMQLQRLWQDAQKLPGDPRKNLSDAINSWLKDSSRKVRVIEATSKETPPKILESISARMLIEKGGRIETWIGLHRK